ncbi:MAG: uroporphyrinogen-III synthase [Acidipropionibacterium sp.]|jgi:uroporphyrinogen-III synthase|nr:uroporphyrinogen-III synthase [Acidipropionibacterium sp.]
MAEPQNSDQTLAGTEILVTAQRRAEDLAAPLRRHGAGVSIVPTLSVEKHIDEPELLSRTRELISAPPAIIVITTGFGLRGWHETADAAGIGVPLVELLNGTRVMARGAKASGALQQLGSRADWVAAGESTAEILDVLVAEGVEGVRIAVQLDGGGDAKLVGGLRRAGAEVTELTVYRWGPPEDPQAVEQAARDLAAGRYDAVAFTAAPGAAAWVASLGQGLDAVRERVASGSLTLVAVGSLCAQPLIDADMPAVWPERSRLGPLIRLLSDVASEAVGQRRDPAAR